jgi:thiol-disulfide isomerase/thioredoxin
MVRFFTPAIALLLTLDASAASTATGLWAELKAKRESLSGAHQEFDVSRTYKTAARTQSSQRQLVIDMAPGRWREASTSGSGKYLRIFDGKDVLRMEDGGDEFVRVKRGSKNTDNAPAPYGSADTEWSKAAELGRQSCGLAGRDDLCVVIEVPVKPWMRDNSARMLHGSARLVVQLDTGLLLSLRVVELVEQRSGNYQSDTTYRLKRMVYGTPPDGSLFHLPSPEPREVKELSTWNAAKIKKQLAGRAAPELAVTDIQGRPVALSDLIGKVVLLDFWTTWCPPCRADATALDKLYRKYGERDLAIVGISVSEDRAIVEGFLKEHPHSFPVVLTTENEMPRPYQIGVFPTYIVINRDGSVESAVEGDQGFSDLRKLLKKAGVEAE